MWVFAIIWMMAKVGNEKFNPMVYNYICGSSLYAYVSHYFFILIISVMIVRPYKIDFIPAFFIMLFGTQICIFCTYVPLNYLYELCVPPKETKKMEVEIKSEKDEATPEMPAEEALAAAKAAAIEGKEDDIVSQDLENEDKSSRFQGEERE